MQNNDTNLILLAFDGLSKNDVDDQWVLDQFQKEYYSSIDLGKRPFYFTSELFTDLYTGFRHSEHGIRALKKMTEGRFGINPTNFELWLQENLNPLFFYTKNLREGFYKAVLDSHRVKWERQDIQMPTIFMEFDNIHQGQMPVWDWRKAAPFHHMEKEYNTTQKCDEHIEDEWQKSRNKFWSNVEQVPWNSEDNQVYVHHFHYIDWLEHLYREKPEHDDREWQDYWEDIMRDPWYSAAEFAEKVEEWASERDIEVVFMSDHGVPEKGIGHRPNPFISTDNTELFDESPTLQEINYVLMKILKGEEEDLAE